MTPLQASLNPTAYIQNCLPKARKQVAVVVPTKNESLSKRVQVATDKHCKHDGGMFDFNKQLTLELIKSGVATDVELSELLNKTVSMVRLYLKSLRKDHLVDYTEARCIKRQYFTK